MTIRPSLLVPGVSALVAFLALGCGGTTSSSRDASARPPDRAPEGVERYFPAPHDTVYAYDTMNETSGEHGVLMLHVTRPREGRVDLKSGSKVERLSVHPDEIQHLDGGWLLRAPVAVGTTFRGKTGQVRIHAVDQVERVAAGTFTDCILTVEETQGATGSRTVRSTFCRDVGLVRLEVEAITDAGQIRERAELRSFGKRVDLLDAPPGPTQTPPSP